MKSAANKRLPENLQRKRSPLTAGLLVVSVASAWGTSAVANNQGEAADVVFRNGYVYTVDHADSVAQAVAVRDGVIRFVGSNAEAGRYIGAGTKVVDLGGRMLMPGLIDGHVHPSQGGAITLQCDLNYEPLTVKKLQDRIKACLDADNKKGDDDWLEVARWDRQAMQKLDRDPTRADLDAISTHRPIVMRSIDAHSLLANSRALTLAGITPETPNPSDGKIVRDANNQLTGMFEDGGLMVIEAKMPQSTDAERVKHAAIALDLLRRQGVTGFLSALSDENEVKAFSTLAKNNALTARAEFAILLKPDQASDPAKAVNEVKAIAAKYADATLTARPNLEVRHVKFFLDGVLQAPAQTAFVLKPYNVNDGTEKKPHWVTGKAIGAQYWKQDDLNAMVRESAKAGLDPHAHAIGDAAVREALDAYDFTRKALPDSTFRPAIAHVELSDPADFKRFRQLDVLPVMSYQWAQQAPYSIEAVKDQLGPDRYGIMEPEGSLYKAGATIAYGSDWPVDPMAYFYNLRVGTTRRGDPNHPASFGKDYAKRLNRDPLLPRSYALRSITMNSAHELKLDKVTGSIETGKFADMIVLDRNFLTAPDSKLSFTKVLLTMVGGRIVWADGPYGKLADKVDLPLDPK